MPVKDVENFAEGDLIVIAIRQNCLHQFALLGVGNLESVDQGQCDFTFPQIVAYRFAKNFFAGGEIQNIVDQLEGDPQVPGIIGQLGFDGFAGSGADGSQAGAGGEQAGGFAVDQLEVIGFGDGYFTDAFQLQQFAFDHHLRQADEQVEGREIAFAHCH